MTVHLDDQQLVAVMSDHDKTLVVAGAGSGKTRVLVERIDHILNLGASPYEIIALTFTRKAAGEMKTRMETLMGRQARKITVGTSHSIAAEMIRRYDPTRSGSSIYGPIETNLVLKDVATEIGAFKKTWKPARAIIDKVMLDYATTGTLPEPDHAAHDVFQAFRHRCAQNRALTYDDLLVEFWALIPTLSKYLNWKYILVDESQDLTPLQWEIINDISKYFGASIYAVGDLDQSIYRFRGAAPKYLLTNCQDYTTFVLETNYRSLPGIVDAGNKVIRNNKNRIEKTSAAFRGTFDAEVCPVKVIRDVDSAGIVSMVGHRPKGEEVAVLARNHFLLKKVSKLLTEKNIDHTYAGSKNDMLRELPAITLHSFLRLCVNPMDNFSFMVIRKIIGVTDQEYAEIRLKATMERVGHLSAWLTSKALNNRFSEFFRQNSGKGARLPEALIDLIEMAGLSTDPHDLTKCWNMDVAPVINFANGWINDNQNGDVLIQSYLDYLALFDVQDELAVGGPDAPPLPSVTLSTVHAAKGLEFSTVIVAGLNEGIFPGGRVQDDPDEEEDERRLCYVAITRAKDRLFLTSRPERTFDKYDHEHLNPVSRFVGEAMGKKKEVLHVAE